MNIIRKSIATIGIALTLAALVIGTYFPYRMSRELVAVFARMERVRTIDEFIGVFDKVFAVRSPYGQEEAARFVGEQLGKTIGAQRQGDTAVIEQLAGYAEKIFAPFLDERRAFLARNLVFLGQLHQTAWQKTGDGRYAARAEELYRRCLLASPRRPECLYGLLRLYLSANRGEEARRTGEEILRYWPMDEGVREVVNSKQ